MFLAAFLSFLLMAVILDYFDCSLYFVAVVLILYMLELPSFLHVLSTSTSSFSLKFEVLACHSVELVLYVYFDLMVNKSGLTFYDVRIVHVGVAQYRAGVLPVFYGCIGLLCDLNDICLPAISFCLTVDQIFLLFVVWSLSSISFSSCMTHFKVLVFNAASSKLL